MKTKLTNLIAVLALALSALVSAPVALAQSVNTYFITNVDAGHFPKISFRLRALDANNHVVPD
ncbi:MAG: hypothetical protein M1140_17770, partial [Chloroflexi bacterium]|nr:hypothetical protein [Chloroflexota bacterium]